MQRSVLFALVMVSWPGGVSRAQPVFTKVQSLEWMAADCPLIVRGTVLDFVRETGDHGVTWDTVVIKVRETIKGRPGPFQTFVFGNVVNLDELPIWKDKGRELLIFLDDSRRVDSEIHHGRARQLLAYESTPRLVSPSRYAIFERKAAGDPPLDRMAYTMDLEELKDYDAILGHVRADVNTARAAGLLRSHVVRWPKGAENVDRIVPVDGRLEALAREWARSDQPALREEGAKALGHFRSDDIVAALKKLLEDPSYESDFEQKGLEAFETGRRFLVRRAAFDSLTRLGIKVAKPVLSVPVTGSKPVDR